MATDLFYAQLPRFTDFNQFTRWNRYAELPSDWSVVITDVQGSTQAIREGKYKDVNTLGAASIVALLNAVKPLRIPYVFGGDGATLCAPSSSKEKIRAALLGTQKMAAQGFGLKLRTGIVDMKTIVGAGHRILVGKFSPSPDYEQAMFAGEGLMFAESLVKGSDPQNPYRLPEAAPDAAADFTGFECRWNEIPSPHGETVAILIKALAGSKESADAVYTQVVRDIIEVYGNEELHHPLRADDLTLTVSPTKLSSEVRVKNSGRSGWIRFWETVRLIGTDLAGTWFMKTGKKSVSADWGGYKQALIANTDYRKFDGLLRMVISGTADQRLRLRALLEKHREAGRILFGLHANPSALITCLISDYNRDHVHFLDGSAGGYTLAAVELKKQASPHIL